MTILGMGCLFYEQKDSQEFQAFRVVSSSLEGPKPSYAVVRLGRRREELVCCEFIPAQTAAAIGLPAARGRDGERRCVTSGGTVATVAHRLVAAKKTGRATSAPFGPESEHG